MSQQQENERLVQQYSEIARLAGGLAHEIKNPLSTITLNVDLLAEDFEESDHPEARRARRKIDVVRRECRRLQALLDDFLNFARAHTLELEPEDLNRQVREALDFFRASASEAGIEIVEYFACDLPTVPMDRRSFHRALLNLLLNAKEAMSEGGQLVVRTRHAGDVVALDLIDNGPGIDPKSQNRIFDTFFSTKKGGTGLGLPTTRKIIEAHGGRIDVMSELGRGTQFTITLPSLPRLAAG